MAGERGPLYWTDEWVYDLVRMAGCPDPLVITLSLEQVEELFDQLAARSEGSSYRNWIYRMFENSRPPC